MKKWYIIFLVLFLLLQSAFLFGLSEEEKEILPELSNSVLIEIILEKDQALIEVKILSKKQGLKIQDLEILVVNSEKTITQLSTELKIQTILSVESLQLQKETARKTLKDKILIGLVTFTAGYFLNELIQ